jgi:cell shape-determining protein MreD
MVTALLPISAVAFKVTPKIMQSLTSALQFVIPDVGILIALLRTYVLVSVVIQNITKIQIIVSHFVLLVALMETAQNPTNAPVILVISDIIRIPIDVYQIALKGVKMVYALLQIHALAMKALLIIRARAVFPSVQKVVSMETALLPTDVIVSLDGLEQTVQFFISKQIQV